MAQFSDILDKPATEIDRPKTIPVGSYVWMINGLPRFDKSREKQTEFYEFECKGQEALDDVDEEALQEWSKRADGTSRSLQDMTQKLTFYITPDSVYRLQEFLGHLGIDLEGKSIRQAIDETPNCTFVGSIVHKASPDGTRIYANIGKTAPVEA